MCTDNQKPEERQPMTEAEAEEAWDNAPDADPAEFWLSDYPDDELEVPEGYMLDPDDGMLVFIGFGDEDEDFTPDPLDPNMKLASDEVLASLAAKLNETPNADPMQAEFARLEAMVPDEALEALREKLKQKPAE